MFGLCGTSFERSLSNLRHMIVMIVSWKKREANGDETPFNCFQETIFQSLLTQETRILLENLYTATYDEKTEKVNPEKLLECVKMLAFNETVLKNTCCQCMGDIGSFSKAECGKHVVCVECGSVPICPFCSTDKPTANGRVYCIRDIIFDIAFSFYYHYIQQKNYYSYMYEGITIDESFVLVCARTYFMTGRPRKTFTHVID